MKRIDPYFQVDKSVVVFGPKGRVIGEIFRYDDREDLPKPSRRKEKQLPRLG